LGAESDGGRMGGVLSNRNHPKVIQILVDGGADASLAMVYTKFWHLHM
jgi:hypothetical protein